jgi:hypothetical protein
MMRPGADQESKFKTRFPALALALVRSKGLVYDRITTYAMCRGSMTASTYHTGSKPT